QHLKGNGGHGKEVNGYWVLAMFSRKVRHVCEGVSAAQEVLAHAGLADIDAELHYFAVNARPAPVGILAAPAADQFANARDMAGRPGLPLRTFQVKAFEVSYEAK